MSVCNPHKFVEILYPFESETTLRGHVVNLTPGEKFRLISNAHDPWWYCAKELDQDDGFYLPSSHVKLVEVDRVSSFRSDDGVRKRASQLVVNEKREGEDGASLRKVSPGFKLADPNRISKSIPGNLNFVHNIADLAAKQQALSLLNDSDAMPSSVLAIPLNLAKSDDSSSMESSIINQSSSRASSYARDESQGASPTPIKAMEQEGARYENMQGASSLSRARAPHPSPSDTPIRRLPPDEEWAEYKDAVGRTYFHHANTQYSQWKPPRGIVYHESTKDYSHKICVNDTSVLSSSCETEDSFNETMDKEDKELDNSVFLNGSNDVINSDVIVDEDKTTNSICNNEQTTNIHNLFVQPKGPPSLPEKKPRNKGNSEQGTSGSNNNNIINDPTKVEQTNSLSRSLTLSNRGYNMPANNRNTVYELSDTLAKIHAGERMRDDDRMECQQVNLKTGMLCKCKYLEAGKRIKKQWVYCFVYLTNAHLIFYKDKKSSERKGPHFDAPLGVCDLRGASVKWGDRDTTKRSQVIQLQLIDETMYLFHLDSLTEISSWYSMIDEVIGQLPRPERYPSPAVIEQPGRRPSVKKSYRKSEEHALQIPNKQGSVKLKPKGSIKKGGAALPSCSSPKQIMTESTNSQETISKGNILEKLRKFFKHRPTVDELKSKGIYKAEPVFGSSLLEICRREKRDIPLFITEVTRLIEDKGLDVDGLYRVCGNLSQVQKLRCQVDQDKYTLLENEGDMSVLAGTLKLFFRELQEPVFPSNMTKNFLDSIKIQNSKQRLKSLQDNLNIMPAIHRDTLRHLLQHLIRVTEHSSKNRMQAHNLAIVFGPTLFCSGGDIKREEYSKGKRKGSKGTQLTYKPCNNTDPVQSNSHMAFNMIMQGQIVEYMLKEFTRLFPAEAM